MFITVKPVYVYHQWFLSKLPNSRDSDTKDFFDNIVPGYIK